MSSQSIDVECQPAALDHSPLPFADGRQIAVVRITEWLDWITQNNQDVFVALPMIQRGSVWDAKHIADLWDSLLRGMPIGSFTVFRSQKKEPEMVRDFGGKTRRVESKPIKEGSLFLLDGQQRSLAMCIGWPWKEEMYKRVWVDFGQPGVAEQPFRLRVTTEYHPFGFNQNDAQKLKRWERRDARDAFNERAGNETKYVGIPDYKLPLDETTPYRASHPLELRGLIRDWQNAAQDVGAWSERTMAKLSIPEGAATDEIARRVREFGAALARLFEMEIALVCVRPELVQQDATDSDVPPLIVLFNRIANAGEKLSPADYIFSLIKRRFPEAHNLVQELLHNDEPNVASLLSANDLVMTSVRLAANTPTSSGVAPFADNPTPSPKDFGRMLKAEHGDFLENALMPLIRSDNAASPLHTVFRETHRLLAYREELPSDPGLPKLAYREELPSDPGLPKLAFPLLQRQLVQVLVFWIHRRHMAVKSEETLRKQFDASRTEILRFVLFWLLCLENREKEKELAGKIAFKMLRETDYESFPGEQLYKELCAAKLAFPLVRPETIRTAAISMPKTGAKIRSYDARFYAKAEDGTDTETQPLYRRWFFRKDLLLWLQRKTLAAEFKGANPLAGRDEETPYDYDHICPQADWGADYRSDNFALKRFCEKEREAWVVGNCIGNYRIEESSANRSHGDASAPLKLGLNEMDSDVTQSILKESAITMQEAEGWKACAEKDRQGRWDEQRALAFQKVVEERAFRLFEQYFKEGGFDEWNPAS